MISEEKILKLAGGIFGYGEDAIVHNAEIWVNWEELQEFAAAIENEVAEKTR